MSKCSDVFAVHISKWSHDFCVSVNHLNFLFSCVFCVVLIDKKVEKVYTSARKQMLISSLPPVITLHLKRFHQVSNHSQPFCRSVCLHILNRDIDTCLQAKC